MNLTHIARNSAELFAYVKHKLDEFANKLAVLLVQKASSLDMSKSSVPHSVIQNRRGTSMGELKYHAVCVGCGIEIELAWVHVSKWERSSTQRN